ncbi:MAG: nitrous oxide reductase accessory protein NosL [Hyphomicrobium sp.]|jgi:copper chaperone NosL|nr:nitrous oxide reductase accessory protein NosL [Hyphomicrobium sp.]
MNVVRLLCICAMCVLAACGQETVNSAAPREPDKTSVGFFCRMGLSEHKGPKGQILPKGWTEPLWFSSVRDALTYAETEVVSENEMAGFWVNDMGRGTWDKPEPGAWVAAQDAWYVIDSPMTTGMGGAEAVPFKERGEAEAFAAEKGGRIVGYAEAKSNLASSEAPDNKGET